MYHISYGYLGRSHCSCIKSNSCLCLLPNLTVNGPVPYSLFHSFPFGTQFRCGSSHFYLAARTCIKWQITFPPLPNVVQSAHIPCSLPASCRLLYTKAYTCVNILASISYCIQKQYTCMDTRGIGGKSIFPWIYTVGICPPSSLTVNTAPGLVLNGSRAMSKQPKPAFHVPGLLTWANYLASSDSAQEPVSEWLGANR